MDESNFELEVFEPLDNGEQTPPTITPDADNALDSDNTIEMTTTDLSSLSLQIDEILHNQDVLIQLNILLMAVIAAFFVSYAIFRYLR